MNEVEKYTANYTYSSPNFVIQNINGNNQINNKYYPMYCVLKNIIQRGRPTTMSKYLQNQIGAIPLDRELSERVVLIDKSTPIWIDTIKGDEGNNYYPAKDFFEKYILEYLDEFKFVQQLILPEVPFGYIVENVTDEFVDQQVDFYLPQAKLVIEIDGQQHKLEDTTRINDKYRDEYLAKNGVKTVRIDTKDLESKNVAFLDNIQEIKNRLSEYGELLSYYERYYNNPELYETEFNKKVLRATAVIRFQITILSLLQKGIINLTDDTWTFNILQRDVEDFAEIAIEDLFIWLKNLCKLNKLPYNKPNIKITYCKNEKDFRYTDNIINIDFSLLKKWTDENNKYPKIIFIRTDYFDRENYFKVSTADPIKYKIINDGEESDVPALKFLLENIFGFNEFNDGQLPIIINSLSCTDTIGLLPTGAGKSLCYQFSALLQPCISFVVCPIKSLMYDQKYNTEKKHITHTNYITSDQKAREKKIISKEFAEGKYFFIWISPERFQSPDFRDYLDQLNKDQTIALAVIDEVHCLSEWGHDFRTSYLNLVKTIRKYCPSATFLGLTATASSFVLEDLKAELDIDSENIKTLTSFTRPELKFYVKTDDGEDLDNKKIMILNLLEEIDKSNDVFILDGENTKSGLIFTPHKQGKFGCYDLSNEISRTYNADVRWFSGEVPTKSYYEFGRKVAEEPVMDIKKFDKYKMDVQKDFQENKFPLLVATKAFGMGIDKPNIRYTIHYGIPGSLESLYQEAGRAGRDRKESNCYVLYTKENMRDEELDILFHPDTDIEEIKGIHDKYGYKEGRDVLRNFFFWLNSNKGVDYEFNIMNKIYCDYAKKDVVKLIKCKELGYSFPEAQKAIYRLSLLGIIDDWTIKSWNKGREIMEVQFGSFSNISIFEDLLLYIRRYDKEFVLDNKYTKDEKYGKYVGIYLDNSMEEYERYMRVLLEWGYDNIVYNRRQSIKNILELCDGYTDPDTFKEGIERYFRFYEKSYLLDHIAQSPKDFISWVDVFYEIEEKEDKDGNLIEYKRFNSMDELENIKGSLSRLLESYRYNTGLNYVSGIVRFLLGEFNNRDGKPRLESALKQINKYEEEEKIEILNKTLEICKDSRSENKEDLSELLCDYFPDEKVSIYDSLKDNYSLLLIIEESKDRLQNIGGMF